MQLTVLGCRAGMPAYGQPSSGYLVETGKHRLLLDCGPGIATALTATCQPSALDAVLISHLHVDHCHDLLPLGKSLLSPLALAHFAGQSEATTDQDLPRVPLYVPAGARPMLDTWSSLLPVDTMPLLDRVFDAAFEVREYRPDDRITIGDTTIEMIELKHTKPNCGMRITDETGSLAYTGDTGVCNGLPRLADGVDLLLAEASLERTDVSDHGHLSAADAARAATEGRAASLVLTHLPSNDEEWLNARRTEAAELFTGPIHLATPGTRFHTS